MGNNKNALDSGIIDATRRRLLRTSLAILPATALAGVLGACAQLPGQGPPPRLFELSPKSTYPEGLPTVDWQLIIEPPTSPAGLDTTRITLKRTAREQEYYARARWTDISTTLVQTLIVESFENSGKIIAVGRESLGLRADFVLKTELREFQALYLGATPEAHVKIGAKLVKMPERAIVGSESFEARVPATQDNIEAVVDAFDDALGKVLRRLIPWTLVTADAVEQSDPKRRR